jgi:hypothetical protein
VDSSFPQTLYNHSSCDNAAVASAAALLTLLANHLLMLEAADKCKPEYCFAGCTMTQHTVHASRCQSCCYMLCLPIFCRAQCWWTFILFTVVVTLFVEPYSLAFAAFPGLQ